MENFYVYRHIRLDKGTPFYVGKGRGRRAWHKGKTDHNKYWKRITNKHGYKVEIIMDNLTEVEAFNAEIGLIKLYRRFGYCEANITNGGAGTTGSRHTKEHKKRLSEDNTGEGNPFFGRKHTIEAREIMSDKHKGRVTAMKGKRHTKESLEKMSNNRKGKHVGKQHHNWNGYIVTPKAVFDNVKEAAEAYDMCRQNIEKKLGSDLIDYKYWFYTKDLNNLTPKSDKILRKRKIRDRVPGKKVINIITSEVFISIVEAAKSVDISYANLCDRLNGRIKNKTDLRYLKDIKNER